MKNNSDFIKKKKQSQTCIPCAFSFIWIGESYLSYESSQASALLSRVRKNLIFFIIKLKKFVKKRINKTCTKYCFPI